MTDLDDDIDALAYDIERTITETNDLLDRLEFEPRRGNRNTKLERVMP